jgi:hypothetical protein
MDYTSYPTKANADYYLALADVEGWLKQLEVNGGTVADLKSRIEIMQAVADKLSSDAKINLEEIDVKKVYAKSVDPFSGMFASCCCSSK